MVIPLALTWFVGRCDGAVSLVATLRAGQPRGHSLILDSVSRCFLFSKTPRRALEPTLSPIQWILRTLTGGIAAGA